MKLFLNLISLTAAIFPLGLAGYYTYLFINMWTNKTCGLLKFFLLSAALFTGIFFAAFFSGISIRIGARSEFNALTTALLWSMLIIAAAIYPWFAGSYDLCIVVQRIIWDVILLGAGIWIFLMVSMVAAYDN